MTEKLLACPFCAGEADCNNDGIMDKDGKRLWWVECLECACCTDGFAAEEEASKTWNRRANPDVGNPISEPVTNSDRIRSATDEELAHEMLFFVPSDFDRHYTGVAGGYYKTAEVAVQANLDWLRQPAKEEHHEAD